MTESQVKQAALNNGFHGRMQQLIAKTIAAETSTKSAGAEAMALTKYVPKAMSLLRGAGEAAGEAGGMGGRIFGEGGVGGGATHIFGEGAGMGAQKLLGQGAPWYQNILGQAGSLMKAHPGVTGALGGAAGVKGMDEYGDYRRRQQLRNMGGFKRLGLALQMALSPESAIQSMHL